MTTTINEIYKVIDLFRRVNKRVTALTALGYNCEERPCGSGGAKRVIETKKEYRIQIGYGHSRSNYAMCVIINK